MSALASARRSAQWLVTRRLVNSTTSLRSSTAFAWTSPTSTSATAGSSVSLTRQCFSTSSNPLQARWFSTSPTTNLLEEEEEEEERYFADLDNLDPRTLQALEKKMGIQTMTEIQAKTWDAVSEGKDVLGRSRTGSGKVSLVRFALL